MINNFIKTINNRYSRFFRFIFFLKYLFLIFFIAIAVFLIIPNFFNYEKRVETVKSHLIKNYNYEIYQYEKIKFHALPFPRLEFKNTVINLGSSSNKMNVQNLKIYLKFFSIYDYKNFQSRKIELEKNNISLESTSLKFLIKNFFNQKNKLLLDNLDIEINDKNNSIINLENITFSNFGYNKNLFIGEVFDKKFKIKISNDFKNINFKLPSSGISADINFDDESKNNLLIGVFKSKILNTNLKFNFNYDSKSLNIYNSYFRSKNLSFRNESIITVNPFLDIFSKFKIEDINTKILKKFNFEKLLKSKNFLKKINSRNEINFVAKKFSHNLINKLNLKINFAYGRMNYIKKFSISESLFQCEGNLNFLEEYPLLFFDCSIDSENREDLLKKFSVKLKDKDKTLKLNLNGNISILKNKININSVSMNKVYEASDEDLRYFKDTFENIVFDKRFIEIFSFKKIKKFILEIS